MKQEIKIKHNISKFLTDKVIKTFRYPTTTPIIG